MDFRAISDLLAITSEIENLSKITTEDPGKIYIISDKIYIIHTLTLHASVRL